MKPAWIARFIKASAVYLGAYALIFLGTCATVVLWTQVHLGADELMLIARKAPLYAATLGTVVLVALSARRK